jgi:hypothetical protein
VTDLAWFSLSGCILALAIVLTMAMRDRSTFGLPLAYTIALLFIHVPGALAYAASDGAYSGMAAGDYPAIGITLTLVGVCSFIAGLALVKSQDSPAKRTTLPALHTLVESRFLLFCLLAGWVFSFGAGPLRAIPTLGAAINFGSAIWILGVMLGLHGAISRRKIVPIAAWGAAILVYPSVILIFGGFLSYGSTTLMIILAFLLAQLRKIWLAGAILIISLFAGLSLFVNYFEGRSALRDVLWSGAGTGDRVDAVANTFSDFKFFSTTEPSHLDALALRLNQNEFVGIAYERLQNKEVEFLQGRSFYEGLIALVPRALWPDKPVFGGSGSTVRDMTGLQLSETTSWGVGNVMEFYINFGLFSLVGGFLVLGFLIGWLDTRSVRALRGPEPEKAVLFFLPGVALVAPGGSMVELVAGPAAALLAAWGWVWLWRIYGRGGRPGRLKASRLSQPTPIRAGRRPL